MAILYRSYTVWSCATGRVPGGDHLPTGELYRGIIYFRHIDSVGDMHRLSIIMSDGSEVKIHHEQEYAGTDRVRIYRRGMTQDGYWILEVEPQVEVPDRYMGIRSVDMQAYFETSKYDYNALSHASFKLWESSSNGGITIQTNTGRPCIDNTVEHAWYNELVDLDGEVITFDEHAGDRLVIFSFTTDVVPIDGGDPGRDPFVQWRLQLKRTDQSIIASSPVAYLATGGITLKHQIDLSTYIRGDDDPLIMYGCTPEIYNNGGGPVKFKNAELNIYTVDTPRNPYLVFNGK